MIDIDSYHQCSDVSFNKDICNNNIQTYEIQNTEDMFEKKSEILVKHQDDISWEFVKTNFVLVKCLFP